MTNEELLRRLDVINQNLIRAQRVKKAEEFIIGFLLVMAVLGWLR